MLKSVSIENFRGIRGVEIDSLARVNLILGANSTGKTSVLEALFLLASGSNPEQLFVPNLLRTLGTAQPYGLTSARWLFPNADLRTSTRIVGTYPKKVTNRLSIRLTTAVPRRLRYPNAVRERSSSPVKMSNPPALEVVFSTPKHTSTGFAVFEPDGSVTSSGEFPTVPPSIFIAANSRGVDLNLLSRILESGLENDLVAFLKPIHPEFSGLKILLHDGIANAFAELDAPARAQRVPIQLVGDGAIRALHMVVATMCSSKGLTLIDEFDNGLGYRAIVSTWKATIKAARSSDAQLFCTTHSYECIAAALEAAGSDIGVNDIAIHRLERDGEDIRVVSITADEARGMIRRNFEIR